MVIVCDASDITRHDKRTIELSNALIHMKHDTTSI